MPVTNRRRAFTLIELLIVMTIIAVMMTLVVSVIGGFLSMAREAATKTTLTKIQGLLDSRTRAFDRQIKRNGYLKGTAEYQDVNSAYGNVLPDTTQQILAIKLLEAKFFPQYWKETSAYQSLYGKSAGAATIYNNSNATNEQILYDFLTQSNALGDAPVNQDAFSAAEVRADKTTGLGYFVDAWETPIRFYRWPTRLFCSGGQTATDAYGNKVAAAITAADIVNAKLLFTTLPVFSGNLANDLARDPDDPLRECVYNFQPTGLPIFENFVMPSYGVKMHTPATYYVMMVVSAGPDKQFGMYSPDFIDPAGLIRGDLGQVQNSSFLEDDIISIAIRAGGK